MQDELEASTTEEQAADTNVSVAVVVPVESDAPNEVDSLRAQVAALQASLDAHYAAHAEIALEDANDRPDDIGDEERGGSADSEPEETQEPEPIDRPIRGGFGGWLFGPVRRKRD